MGSNNDLGELPLARSMTPTELVSLIDGGLIQIGSHTVTHPVLSELSEQERRYEISMRANGTWRKFWQNPCTAFLIPMVVSQKAIQSWFPNLDINMLV
jgi:hypothetical protein